MLRQGLLWVPLRLGWAAWRRMDAHSEGGALLHRRFAMRNGAHKRLDLVCTTPALQGRGLQTRILNRVCADADACTDAAGAAECDGVLLYLSTSDTANQRYYRRFGFEEVGRIAHHGIVTVGMARLPQGHVVRGLQLVHVGEVQLDKGGEGRAESVETRLPVVSPSFSMGLAAVAIAFIALHRLWKG